MTRRFDGRPETPADTRFYELREAGYTGPIDQDGYPVTDPATVDVLDALARIPTTGQADEHTADEM